MEKKLIKVLEDVLEFMKVQDNLNRALDTKLSILKRRIDILENKLKENDNIRKI